MTAFVVLGGPFLVIAFGLGLLLAQRLVAAVGVAAFGAGMVWALTDDRATEFPLWIVVVIWLVAWFVGLGLAGLVRGAGWLFGIGARDD